MSSGSGSCDLSEWGSPTDTYRQSSGSSEDIGASVNLEAATSHFKYKASADADMDDGATTVMLRGLVRTVSLNIFMKLLSKTSTGYDLVHLPSGSRRNIGLAFVNYENHEAAKKGFKALEQVSGPHTFRSVRRAYVQGLGPNLAYIAVTAGVHAIFDQSALLILKDGRRMKDLSSCMHEYVSTDMIMQARALVNHIQHQQENKAGTKDTDEHAMKTNNATAQDQADEWRGPAGQFHRSLGKQEQEVAWQTFHAQEMQRKQIQQCRQQLLLLDRQHRMEMEELRLLEDVKQGINKLRSLNAPHTREQFAVRRGQYPEPPPLPQAQQADGASWPGQELPRLQQRPQGPFMSPANSPDMRAPFVNSSQMNLQQEYNTTGRAMNFGGLACIEMSSPPSLVFDL